METKKSTEIGDIQSRREETDYANRKRNLEWRQDWFYQIRPQGDKELLEVWQRGLRLKRQMIEKQRGIDGPHGRICAGRASGSPWFTIGPRNVNGRVKALAVHPTDPDTVYAGAASGGVWKSTDGGQSWRPLWDEQDTMACVALAIAPSAPDTIYVGTGEWTPGWGPGFPGTGVFVSTDAGATWTQRTAVVSRRVAQILVSPTDANRVYLAGESGFERSTDAGVTWTTVRAGQISDAVIDPNAANTLYINVRSDGIYKTTDGGTTWTKLAGGAPSGAAADWIRLAIGRSGAAGSNLVLAKRSGTIYRTTDGGTNWTTLAGSHGDSPFHEWCNLLSVAPDDDNIILAGGVGAERTANGGTTWAGLGGLHADHHRAVFAPSNPNIVYTCNDGGVYRSDRQGRDVAEGQPWPDRDAVLRRRLLVGDRHRGGRWNAGQRHGHDHRRADLARHLRLGRRLLRGPSHGPAHDVRRAPEHRHPQERRRRQHLGAEDLRPVGWDALDRRADHGPECAEHALRRNLAGLPDDRRLRHARGWHPVRP